MEGFVDIRIATSNRLHDALEAPRREGARMSGDTVSEFGFLTLRDLRNCIHVLLQKTPEADWHELSPLLEWAYAVSFDLLGSGPFRIPKKHPNGKNSPPDCAIYS